MVLIFKINLFMKGYYIYYEKNFKKPTYHLHIFRCIL